MNRHTTSIGLWLAISGSLLATPLALHAQTYPNKPIRLVLPYPPGGGTDFIMRPIADKLTERLGQQVIIDNRGGANGSLGMEMVARATPDGYTIVLALTAQLAINPSFYPKLPYDPIRDYTPITLLGTATYMLVVHPAFPAKSVKELIAVAKSKPGQIAYASSGTGGIPHLAVELLKSSAGIDMIHVPYKGGGPAIVDVLGGRVQLTISTVSPLLPYVKSGRLRAIAVTSARRSQNMPELPTVAETVPGYEASSFYGMLAPAHTPQAVIGKLHSEFALALAIPEINEKLRTYDFEPIAGPGAELAALTKSEIVRWAKVIKDSGAKPD